MANSPLPESKQRALERFLKSVARLPAEMALYASVLGVVALTLSGGTSVAETVILGVGINVITNLFSKLSEDEELSTEEISTLVRDAISQSGIGQLEQQNQNILIRLLKESHAIEQAVKQGDNETGKLLSEQIKLLSEKDSQLNQISTQLVALIGSYQEQVFNQQKLYQLLEKAIPAFGNTSFPNLAQLDDQPVKPTIYAPRSAVLEAWRERLATATWITIVDGPGRGKSQLTRSISEQYDKPNLHWVSLPDYENFDFRQHFRQQVSFWALQLQNNNALPSSHGPTSLHDIAASIGASVGNKGILIVDNLPDPAHHEELYSDLEVVAEVFRQHGTKMLTTSQRDLPQRLHLHLGHFVLALNPPPFSQRDVIDLLQSAGASQEFLQEKVITILLGVTEGHPSLLAATVYWLKQQNWHLGATELQNLLSGTPMKGVREDERRRMLSLLNDQSKQLVYRLSLLYGKFDAGLVWKIAEVFPPIIYPAECLDTLTGPWLTRSQEDTFQITPLLKDIGRNNLSTNLKRNVSRIAADHYFSQAQPFSPEIAFEIAMYFWGAESYTEFVTFTIQLMRSAETPAHARYIDWVTFVIPPTSAWPDELDLDLKIIFRTMQIRTRTLAGRASADLETDLNKLTKQAGPDNLLSLLIAYFTDSLQDFSSFLHAIPNEKLPQQITQLFQLLRQELGSGEGKIADDLTQIIWTLAAQLKGKDQTEQFLVEISKLTSAERSNLFDSDLATESIQIMVDRVGWAEETKSGDQQNWSEVSRFASEVQEVGSNLGIQSLRAAGIRAKAVVLTDHLHQAAEALNLLEHAMDIQQDASLFLIKYTTGFILSDAKQTGEALRYLKDALAIPGETFLYFRFDAQRRIALLYSMTEQFADAEQWFIKALHYAERQTSLIYHRLELMGELAWIHWSQGSRPKACGALYGLIYGLLANENLDEPRFREVFKKTGHAMGWYMTVAKTGSGPASTITGDIYTSVEAGFFGIIRERLGESTPLVGFSQSLLLTQLGILCENLELLRIAWKVYCRVDALPVQDALSSAPYLTALTSLNTIFGTPTTAIECVLKTIKVLGATERLLKNERLSFAPGQKVDFEVIWSKVDFERRRTVEDQIFYSMVLGPLFTQLLASDLSSDQVLEQWKDAVTTHKESLASFEHWISALEYIRQLLIVSTPDQIPAMPAEESLFQMFQHLAISRCNGVPIHTSLELQAISFNYFLQLPENGRYFMPGISQFLYSFWINVAEKQSFSLNSPQLFREELSKVRLRYSTRAAAMVLRSATFAVGLRLPSEVVERFRNAEK